MRSKDAVKPLDKSPIASPSMDEGYSFIKVMLIFTMLLLKVMLMW